MKRVLEDIYMKRLNLILKLTVACLALLLAGPTLDAKNMQGGMLDYEVISIDANTWIVTAREISSGNVVKFRLPPSTFKGQTFDAEIGRVRPGQRFAVRGPRNASLANLVMDTPSPQGQGRGLMRKPPRMMTPPSRPLSWEILNVNPQKWIVQAKNRMTHRTAKFKVDPGCFAGFRFRSNLQSVGKGQGFSIITPFSAPLTNCCTLMELK